MTRRRSILPLALALALAACSSPNGKPGSSTGSLQAPPTTSASELDSWLSSAAYTQWHCEAAAHPARSPSPHGSNRICSNDALSGHGTGEFPVGAAAVKEIYSSGGGVTGHAVYLHVRAGTDGGSWFWYEKIGGSVGAFGLGDSAAPRDVCVGCHQGAGSDAQHSGHDFVYTQVR